MSGVPQGTWVPQNDPSACDVPPIVTMNKAPRYRNWIIGGVLAIILIGLTTAVIYLYFQDASTGNAINYKDRVMEEIQGELLRFAAVIQQQSEKEEATAAKMSSLVNQSNTLKLQVADMVLQEEAMNKKMSALVNETDALKLLVAYVLVKENVTAQRTSAVLEQSDLLRLQLSEVVSRIESALQQMSGNETVTRVPASQGQGAGVASTAVRLSPCVGFLLLPLACYTGSYV